LNNFLQKVSLSSSSSCKTYLLSTGLAQCYAAAALMCFDVLQWIKFAAVKPCTQRIYTHKNRSKDGKSSGQACTQLSLSLHLPVSERPVSWQTAAMMMVCAQHCAAGSDPRVTPATTTPPAVCAAAAGAASQPASSVAVHTTGMAGSNVAAE
jgi:hypothetical protein